ncbi:uncharacterized protein LOC128238876 [Mya arenaria]|uniref:uncharacterized protein LOC128238876 n=1 Tax=Mya arenaria TaxID=6604 RepID=UPI0022E2248E|nr:uncharacterized protein LOC128238876 [Mya arenaria]
MGVDIETYRGRIGGFKGSIGCDVVTVPCNVNFSSGMNAFGAVVFIGLLLIMGGIEPNPGPPQKDSKSENSGTFEIHGQEGIIKYYCRVNSETDLKTILNPWGIRNPGFILSAAGNADNVHEQFRRDHFIKETTTLIRNTGAILTTAVGGWLHELVRDIIDEVRILSDYKPVVIGIFKWESTKDTFTELPNKLMKEDRDDSHFTHFIFVENEKQCTSILWKLNSCLSEDTADDTITPTILLTHCIDTLAIECAVAAFQSNKPLTLLQTDETSQLLKTLRKKQNDKELNNSRTLDPIHLKLGLFSDTLPEESYEGYLRESIYKDQDNFHINVIEGFKRMNAKNIDLLKLWIVLNPTATKLCSGLDTGRLKDINYKNRLFAFILKKNIVHELLYSDTVYLKLFCEKELPKMFDNPGDGSDTNSLCHVADKIRKKLGIHVAVKDGKMETDEQAIFFIFMWSLLKQKGSVSDWAYNKMTSKMTAALVGSKYLKKTGESKHKS